MRTSFKYFETSYSNDVHRASLQVETTEAVGIIPVVRDGREMASFAFGIAWGGDASERDRNVVEVIADLLAMVKEIGEKSTMTHEIAALLANAADHLTVGAMKEPPPVVRMDCDNGSFLEELVGDQKEASDGDA